jgi:hypothetical protein
MSGNLSLTVQSHARWLNILSNRSTASTNPRFPIPQDFAGLLLIS